jgi:hypothetical protein
MSIEEYLAKQVAWSTAAFGPGFRTGGITKHIESECEEIRKEPDDLMEWVDVIILALDGYWRAGGTRSTLMFDLVRKQERNMRRTWPKVPEDQPSFHVKETA